jgi:type IV pilus assembly protein PilO
MALIPTDPKAQKLLIIALLPLLLVVGYYYMMHGDYTAEIERKQRRVEQLEARNRAAQQQAQQSGPELEQRLAVYEQHMLRLEELIPREEEVPGLISAMAERAQSSGVEIWAFTPGRAEASPHYNRQTFEMSVIGQYHDVGEFLTAVGSLPRIITATNLRLGVEGNRRRSSGEPHLLASFRIQTYVLPTADTLVIETDG